MRTDDDDDLPELDDEIEASNAEEDDGQDVGQGTGRENDDAQEGDGQEEGEDEEVVAKPSRRNRASDAVREAKQRAKEALADKQRLENEIRELRARVERPPESPEQEAQRLALMTTEERLDYKLAKHEEQRRREQQQWQFQQYDNADKLKYQGLKAELKIAARYESKVEAELTRIRQQTGQTIDRDKLLAFLIGQDVVAKMGKAKDEQRKDGQTAIRKQTTRPVSGGRSDQPPPRNGRISEQEARRRRLANVEL